MDAEKLKECGIDYNKGILFFGKDVELYEKYIAEFAQEDMLEDAIKCLENDNVKGAFASVHKLKALVEYIKIPAADEMVHELTETLREGKTDGVEVGLHYLKEVFTEIKRVVREEIANDACIANEVCKGE